MKIKENKKRPVSCPSFFKYRYWDRAASDSAIEADVGSESSESDSASGSACNSEPWSLLSALEKTRLVLSLRVRRLHYALRSCEREMCSESQASLTSRTPLKTLELLLARLNEHASMESRLSREICQATLQSIQECMTELYSNNEAQLASLIRARSALDDVLGELEQKQSMHLLQRAEMLLEETRHCEEALINGYTQHCDILRPLLEQLPSLTSKTLACRISAIVAEEAERQAEEATRQAQESSYNSKSDEAMGRSRRN